MEDILGPPQCSVLRADRLARPAPTKMILSPTLSTSFTLEPTPNAISTQGLIPAGPGLTQTHPSPHPPTFSHLAPASNSYPQARLSLVLHNDAVAPQVLEDALLRSLVVTLSLDAHTQEAHLAVKVGGWWG